MSNAFYIKIESRVIRTSSTIDCHQEPFSFPSGYSESPTPASAEGASCPDGMVCGDQQGYSILLIFKFRALILKFYYENRLR